MILSITHAQNILEKNSMEMHTGQVKMISKRENYSRHWQLLCEK